jgi:hypothetical protein
VTASPTPTRAAHPVAADARVLNWRFVVPGEPDGLLLLPVDGEATPGAEVVDQAPDALAGALVHSYPAVVAPDLTAWARAHHRGADDLLAALAGAVDRAGWIYAGFANRTSPASPWARGSLGRKRATEVLRRAGITEVEVLAALPDQRCPAFLLSTDDPAVLDYFLRRLFFPHAGGVAGWRARARQQLLRVLRAGALAASHSARVRHAPALAIIGRRPA